jgi:hypothetical protein
MLGMQNAESQIFSKLEQVPVRPMFTASLLTPTGRRFFCCSGRLLKPMRLFAEAAVASAKTRVERTMVGVKKGYLGGCKVIEMREVEEG